MSSRPLTQICLALFASLAPLSALARDTPPESPSASYGQNPTGDLRVDDRAGEGEGRGQIERFCLAIPKVRKNIFANANPMGITHSVNIILISSIFSSSIGRLRRDN